MMANPFWQVEIKGLEKADKNKIYVIVCNHQSLLDALVIFKLRLHFRWVAKTEIFRLPIAGWVMVMNKYLSVKRGDKESGIKMLEKAKKYIQQGNSIMIFPEGTRSADGNLNGFKEGAFTLSLSTMTNILPVIIDGTYKALPKNSLLLKPGCKITLEVLDEIDVTPYNPDDIQTLLNRTRQEMAERFAHIRCL
ncbi:MAG: 1-acyl-sn-glycerol-3-phosphate acyltransferase [Bacteroidales bacterium]|nr:1-acyl-sn-glycerol-3-phosphate acyltransferase [Bacteroidales bacterium]